MTNTQATDKITIKTADDFRAEWTGRYTRDLMQKVAAQYLSLKLRCDALETNERTRTLWRYVQVAMSERIDPTGKPQTPELEELRRDEAFRILHLIEGVKALGRNAF